MSKVIGFEAALRLLRDGHTMIHELPSMRTSINGLTIVHPGFLYLVPYCDRKKQPNGDVFYTLKEKNA